MPSSAELAADAFAAALCGQPQQQKQQSDGVLAEGALLFVPSGEHGVPLVALRAVTGATIQLLCIDGNRCWLRTSSPAPAFPGAADVVQAAYEGPGAGTVNASGPVADADVAGDACCWCQLWLLHLNPLAKIETVWCAEAEVNWPDALEQRWPGWRPGAVQDPESTSAALATATSAKSRAAVYTRPELWASRGGGRANVRRLRSELHACVRWCQVRCSFDGRIG